MSKSTSETPEGREALSVIHINVPRAAKARWVKASQARGMKMTDWLIEAADRAAGERPMNVYPIPDTLASAYQGAGYALAAVAGGQLVALRYIADLAPQLDDTLAEGGRPARDAVQDWIGSDDAAPTVRELQALGAVSVGMCSAWEFVEL